MNKNDIKIITADMGYGHQRPAHVLKHLSSDKIYNINNYEGIPEWEKEYWEKSLESYEKVSRLKKIPLIGAGIFKIMDAFQKIKPLYPFRDLSKPTIQQRYFYSFIKKGLGSDLIKKLDKANTVFLTTFFVAAYIAEYYNFSGDIYCVVCDTDASRAWAPVKPRSSRIKYFLPSEKVKERFLMYGVKEENLFVTGYPLPKDLVGDDKEKILAELKRRIINLDPEKKYRNEYKSLLKSVVPDLKKDDESLKPVTITFAVGGAGAQKEIGKVLLNELILPIKNGEIKLNLVAGVRSEVRDYFVECVKEHDLTDKNDKVDILYKDKKEDYFNEFDKLLKETDILWTKPSELSFYCALGLPIVITEPIGSQEDFNRKWIISMGGGVDSLDVSHVEEWLPDLISSGRLARAAVDAFLNAENKGVYNIEEVLHFEK
ncbi:MAG: hypothetical protein PF488_02405 [Patescibacteria group bacterium]|jgi:hypothetical protein|nr:hypothetical protein [Patescibacteria group bacterium]